jgi:Zn-dependent peptidase ImmA (M78 family)
VPDGCRASGATKFLTPKKALMLLSFRYLADDQFWFTVFHEAGHLLLHANDKIFLEGVDIANIDAEREADEFAATTLFTKIGLIQLQTLPLNHFAIARFAKRIGIAPGVVVGQLQEMKRIPHKHFNYLKARYEWDEQLITSS